MRALMASLSRKREIEADAAARLDRLHSSRRSQHPLTANNFYSWRRWQPPPTRVVDTAPNAGARITAPVGGTAEVDASTMKGASGTAEEASPEPGYDDGLGDGALPETELTAENRSVRRWLITTSAAVEAKTLLMGAYGGRPGSPA